MQNLGCKLLLVLGARKRKREKEKAEEPNLNKTTGYPGPAANIWASRLLPLLQNVPWYKHGLEQGSPPHEGRGDVTMGGCSEY